MTNPSFQDDTKGKTNRVHQRVVGLATAGASAFCERLGYASKVGYCEKYLDTSLSTPASERPHKPAP